MSNVSKALEMTRWRVAWHRRRLFAAVQREWPDRYWERPGGESGARTDWDVAFHEGYATALRNAEASVRRAFEATKGPQIHARRGTP